MSNLFSNLPAPKPAEDAPDAKRQKIVDAAGPAPKAAVAPPRAPVIKPEGGDAVVQALDRIKSHIGNEKKFSKASALARKLLEGGSINSPVHATIFFEILEEAMAHREYMDKPGLRADYSDLIGAAVDHGSVFTRPQRATLVGWEMVACWRGAMHTDDSFEFNRIIKDVNKAIDAIPDATEEEEAAVAAKAAGGGGGGEGVAKKQEEEEEEEEEDDPFGLSKILPDRPAPAAPAEDPAAEALRALAGRREGLVACLEAAFTFYHKRWAQTSIDMMVQGAHAKLNKFGSGPDAPLWTRVMKTYKAAVDARIARQQGITRGGGGDKTSYEKNSDAYKGMAISARAAVGGSADRKNDVVLG